MSKPMTITAKYPGTCGTCASCGGRFAAGAKISWSKGEPSRHADCGGAKPAATPAPKPAAQRAPRLPKLVGSEGALQAEFAADRHDRTPQMEIGEAQWLLHGGRRIAVVLVGYEPATFLRSDEAEDMGHYGVETGWYGVKHFRAATRAEYEALQAASPRADGACEDTAEAVAS